MGGCELQFCLILRKFVYDEIFKNQNGFADT